MAVNIELIISNLQSFYDFNDKTIISVGAGGGRFIDYAKLAQKVYAVDNDKEALQQLESCLAKKSFSEKYTLVHSDFEKISFKTDVAFFEFCLHEMENPELAINHALSMSNEVLVSDHNPDSEWAFIANEDKKVRHSWKALEKFKIKALKQYHTSQHFADYNELFEKVKGQGDESIKRIEKYKNQKNIIIPMSYSFASI